MTLLLVLAVVFLLALAAPFAGVDSRDLAGPESRRDKLWSRHT